MGEGQGSAVDMGKSVRGRVDEGRGKWMKG